MEKLASMLKLSDYDYELPHQRVAQVPAAPRDSCRLLILDRKTGEIRHDIFRNIGNYLSPNDLLVLNNTRVMPARVFAKKSSGGKVELLLLSECEKNVWECLVRPGRRIPIGTKLSLNGGQWGAEVVDRSENGTRLVQFAGVDDVRNILHQIGEIPFPPYVTSREAKPREYQTVYSSAEGSVAAPTAGLHFTEELLSSLRKQGSQIAEITLHVGWGTFRPVRSESITDHEMEKEWYSISPESALLLNGAKRDLRRIVAVGTTASRVVESLPEGEIAPQSGRTNLFIYPGFEFKRVGALITNFHFPRSTLLMLVCALAGRDLVFKAYQEAIEKGYRFYSFGDAMLIV